MVNASSKKRPREKSSSSEVSENEYQVEAIVGKRVRAKRTQYLLKWKGYSDADNTWEFQTNLNCPELVKAFEDSSRKKGSERKSTGKTETKPRKKTTTKSKKSKIDDSDDGSETDEEPSINTNNGTESNKNNDKDTEENGTCPSPILNDAEEPSTKSRLRSTSKTESTHDDIIEENKDDDNEKNETINGEDDNNSSSIELLNKTSPAKETLSNDETNDPPVNLRLRITPSSASSLSLVLNDSDNNNNTNEKSSLDNTMNISNDQDTAEIIPDDDEEPIDKIEGVRNDQEGISFRIRLNGQNETQWIAAKIANRKYPQAVIAFWESHVEFT